MSMTIMIDIYHICIFNIHFFPVFYLLHHCTSTIIKIHPSSTRAWRSLQDLRSLKARKWIHIGRDLSEWCIRLIITYKGTIIIAINSIKTGIRLIFAHKRAFITISSVKTIIGLIISYRFSSKSNMIKLCIIRWLTLHFKIIFCFLHFSFVACIR